MGGSDASVPRTNGEAACDTWRKTVMGQRKTPVTGEALEDLRPLMFSIAYRMLGTVRDAEDAVQEAYLRFHRSVVQGTSVEYPRAFLTTVVTRLAIDQLRSARAQRETYFGPWLPGPLLTSVEPIGARLQRVTLNAQSGLLVFDAEGGPSI
jgi:DNA-directed RNA polymerase specialized sigma24 family protein